MKNIKVLDCTLRDGGRIINCAFPDNEIKELTEKLSEAKIDIVEVGFLRDGEKVKYQGGSTFFTNVGQIEHFLEKKKPGTVYVAFIDYGMFDFSTLKPFDGKSIDGIRFGFTKSDYMKEKEGILRDIGIIKQNGYKLFLQGVNSLNYSDREILELVELVNEVRPYSFGIVDTYGAMYMDDVDRLYGLIDHNMNPDICINFHSHNNYQLSFAFAQEIIRLSHGTRQIIIDGTLSGMGKVAGNLSTELIVDYLVRKLHYDYDRDLIFDVIDEYIYKYSLEHKWGYSVPAMMAGIYKAHPNNIIYLTEKFRLDTKDIGKILSMITPEERQRYDYGKIEKLYMEYAGKKVDDRITLENLKSCIAGRTVLVLVPGDSLNSSREKIEEYIDSNNLFLISVNFIMERKEAFAFYGNQKRYSMTAEKRKGRNVIVSSNIMPDENDFVVNYYDFIQPGYRYFENSTMMLLNLLKKIDVSKIVLAGFDGFQENRKENYYDDSFQNIRHVGEFQELNQDIEGMFTEFMESVGDRCRVEFLTPSIFEDVVRN